MKFKKINFTIFIMFFFLWTDISHSQTRIALVIGNSDYNTKIGRLITSVNDASDIKKALEDIDFNTDMVVNADIEKMEKAIINFSARIKKEKAEIAFFYYSGHGVSIDEKNYLLPVSLESLSSKADIKRFSVDASWLTEKMEESGANLKIMVLDSCRNTPNFSKTRSAGVNTGFSRMNAPKGSIIAFATQDIAYDHLSYNDRNGVYARFLKENIKKSGYTVYDVFNNTGLEVINLTSKEEKTQIPVISVTAIPDYYLAGKGILIPGKPEIKDNPESDYIFAPYEQKIREKEYFEKYQKNMELDFAKAKKISEELWNDDTTDLWKSFLSKYSTDNPYSSEDEILKKKALNYASGIFTNSLGMKFVYIKPGTFMMGSPSSESGHDSDEKQHKVTLTKGYFMQTTEVTQGQWKKVMGENPSHFKNCGDNCPVESVSWNDAKEFIRKLNNKDKNFTYRLPTEAEWEYAARGGTTTAYFFGDNSNSLGNYAWYSGNSGSKIHEAGLKKPNKFGLYDMHGNVWEWCEDRYGDYPSGHVTDPRGAGAGSSRVIRGGSWNNSARYCRSAVRLCSEPGFRNFKLGFRLVAFEAGK